MLKENKNCRVVDLYLSIRTLEFARKPNPFQGLTLLHEDAVIS